MPFRTAVPAEHQTESRGVVRVHPRVQRSLPFISGGRLCIHELFERSWRRR